MLQGESQEQPVNQPLMKSVPSYFSEQIWAGYPWRKSDGSQIKGRIFVFLFQVKHKQKYAWSDPSFARVPSWIHSSLFCSPNKLLLMLRMEVMKWSNYASICAVQVKPGVKFPICTPAVSLIHCTLTLLSPIKRRLSKYEHYTQKIYLTVSYCIERCFAFPVEDNSTK